MPRLNPAQHRLLERHVDRAVEALREADRLLKGAVTGAVEHCVQEVQSILTGIDREESRTVPFRIEDLPPTLVPCLDNPFAQSLAFNHHCRRHSLSHTRATKQWPGGSAAVAARNLVFLPPAYGDLWDEGALDKTRLVAIANRNLTARGYDEVADLVRTRRKEDVDERLLKLPPAYLSAGRRGPEQALEAAAKNGWAQRFATVQVPEDLVQEALAAPPADGGDRGPTPDGSPVAQAVHALRAGLGGVRVATEVEEALRLSPDPHALVERFLAAHRQSGDADPDEVSRTLFFAHAGPMQKLVADDKLLLRHFRPVKTQKRGQLFYRILEALEEAILERVHQAEREQRGITETEAKDTVHAVLTDLNKDPNRYLVVPDDWLGEVTRRHLYFGSRTRKEGAAYKWFRRIGGHYYVGSHKTTEELAEREARRQGRTAV